MMMKDQDALTERGTAMKEDGMDIEPNEGAEIARRVARQWLNEAELIPIRHLSLDLTEPISGWELTTGSSAALRRRLAGSALRRERRVTTNPLPPCGAGR